MREPVRILAFFLLSPYCEYGKIVGGMERRFLEISSHLMALDAEIFTLEYRPSLSESWGYSSYHSIKLNRRFKGHAVLEAVRLIIPGLKACIEFRCDVIYVPGLWGKVNIIPPYVVSLLCRKPLVIVFHHLRRKDYGDRNPIRLLGYRRAKACIAVSQATASDIRKSFKVRHAVVTGNGVNLNKFRNVKRQTKLYDVVYFGRISQEKGIYTLLGAWKIIVKELPSVKLLLVGGIADNMMDTMDTCRKIVEKLGLGRNVAFSGFVSDQQAARILNSSRIFALPSTEEGFGLTVVEAMATGLPCVLSNLPALKENFHSTAVFVKPRDVEELAQAILALLSDPEKCRKLKKRGQRLVKRFSWEAAAKKELEVFRSLVGKETSRTGENAARLFKSAHTKMS